MTGVRVLLVEEKPRTIRLHGIDVVVRHRLWVEVPAADGSEGPTRLQVAQFYDQEPSAINMGSTVVEGK
jgi:hypothetical protein